MGYPEITITCILATMTETYPEIYVIYGETGTDKTYYLKHNPKLPSCIPWRYKKVSDVPNKARSQRYPYDDDVMFPSDEPYHMTF